MTNNKINNFYKEFNLLRLKNKSKELKTLIKNFSTFIQFGKRKNSIQTELIPQELPKNDKLGRNTSHRFIRLDTARQRLSMPSDILYMPSEN